MNHWEDGTDIFKYDYTYTDSTYTANDMRSLQQLYNSYGATEMYVRIATARYYPDESAEDYYHAKMHCLEESKKVCALAAELGMPINVELGCFAAYSDAIESQYPDFSEYPEIDYPVYDDGRDQEWKDMSLDEICYVLNQYGKLVATEIKALGCEAEYRDLGNETNYGFGGVMMSLDNAVAELEESISGEAGTLNDKLTALDSAYKAADTALENAIDAVQAKLNEAVLQLREADTDNYEELSRRLSEFEKAYKEADSILNTSIGLAESENEALARRVAALETLFDISSDISGDVVLLKEELAAAKEALEASDKGLRNDLTELDKVGDNRADAYLAVNIVLGVIVLALVGWLVIKPMIEKRRRKKVRLNNALK